MPKINDCNEKCKRCGQATQWMGVGQLRFCPDCEGDPNFALVPAKSYAGDDEKTIPLSVGGVCKHNINIDEDICFECYREEIAGSDPFTFCKHNVPGCSVCTDCQCFLCVGARKASDG